MGMKVILNVYSAVVTNHKLQRGLETSEIGRSTETIKTSAFLGLAIIQGEFRAP